MPSSKQASMAPNMPPPQVRIVEVSPRDGLQNIPQSIPTSTKLDLISRLSETGLTTIELTSNVSPKAIPQLSDSRQLLADTRIQALLKHGRFRLPVLVPNRKGLEVAIENGVREVAVFVSATEGFSRANVNCGVEESLKRAREVVEVAGKRGVAVRGYVSCIFADPFDGPTKQEAVLRCVQELLDAGCYEISLGDTLGVGTATNVVSLLGHLRANGVSERHLAGHFHDTYGQAISNVWAAYQCGIRVFDSSVGGLGGCPFAPGAKGNVSTEDVLYMFHQAGIYTGVDLEKVASIGSWICSQVPIQNSSRAGPALLARNTHLNPKLSSSATPSRLLWKLISPSSSDDLLIYRSNQDILLVLNRPRNGNALTTQMITSLTSLFQAARTDRSIARIVITASGRYFCTGMDLGKGTSPVGHPDPSQRDGQYVRLTKLFDLISSAPQVTLAVINGPVFAGGVGLAFSCDLRVAVKNATFTLTEVKLGLAPATISKYVVREWGLALSREAMLSALPVTPERLYAAGVLAGVGKAGEAADELVDQWVRILGRCAAGASDRTKRLVELGWRSAGKEEQEIGIKEIFDEMMMPEEEGAFGVKAFQRGEREVDWTKFRKGQKAKL